MRRRRPAPALVLALVLAGPNPAGAADPPQPRVPTAGPKPLAPEQALKAFRTGEGLAVDLVLAEPTVAQPVFLNFDERGRLWVVEYRQYPEPAGLNPVSRDGVWRVVYDRVPKPPPHDVAGKDRISVHEDTDGDGVFDRHKTVIDGLNIATAVARGRGGLWVLNPPYLLFYPDKDDDDVPDGDPEVRLEGFGLEDTHSVVNSLCWGPDGWLYAAQGSTVSGRVRRPGGSEPPVLSMGQLIWRYHPEQRRYEVFAEGGGNAFGVEIDAKGRIYSGHNGGDTRGFHYVQGGYYRKGFDKHGPLSNPYAFGYFGAMRHPNVPRFTHTFLVYEADALPDAYRGKLFGVAPLLSHVVLSEVTPDGSTFQTRDVGFPLTTSDGWFKPVDVKLGPDGGVYVADWYDGQANHYRNHEGQIDRNNGRVYRLRAAGSKPSRPVNLGALSTAELVKTVQSHPNRWHRQTALRLLGDRKDSAAAPGLKRAVEDGTGQSALESLWALSLCGGLDEAAALSSLGHADPYVRLWSARLLGDRPAVSAEVASALADRARVETHPEVRSQLACTARRLPPGPALAVVRALLLSGGAADDADPHVPLLAWWAVEAQAGKEPAAALGLFRDAAVWKSPVGGATVAPRLMRRFAATGTRKDLQACADLLALAPAAADAKRLMAGFEAGLAGRSVAGLPGPLAEALAKYQGAGGSVVLGVRQGNAGAVAEALRTLADPKGDRELKLRLLQALGEADRPGAVPALLALARRSDDGALQAAALSALRRSADVAVGPAVVAALPAMTDDVRASAFELLASRPAWAGALVDAAGSGALDPKAVPDEFVRRLQRYPSLAAAVAKTWPGVRPATPAELKREIDRVAAVLKTGRGDPRAGERLFARTCAGCHTLFGQGGKVGPDLTPFRRDDTDTLLLSVVHPSAEIREGYGTVVVATADGRTLAGILTEQDPQALVVRGADGRDQSLRRDEVEAVRGAPESLMPEGVLKGLGDREVRDLFAYLRANQPPK